MSLQPLKKFDSTFTLLLFSNIATIILALSLNWGLMTILWGYWLQSVIIGFFTFIKLLILSSKTSNETIGPLGGVFLAFFFAAHYGLFHFGYMMFLIFFSLFGFVSEAQGFPTGALAMPIDFLGIAIMGAIFFVTHGFSFVYHLQKSKGQQVTMGTMHSTMMEPYKRIVPMHLTILFGGWIIMIGMAHQIVLVFFLLLKTAADLWGHGTKHKRGL
ncbi:MAG: hypothetical protein JW772_03040 [Candidatus Diapherotrites archaeon]|nr:hypothetical protein [Candidatus Diapherotrites archaeon]